MGFCVCSMFCCALFCVLSIFAIILIGKKAPIALLCSSSWCLVIIIVLLLFLVVPWVGLQCVIVAFTDHTHLLFYRQKKYAILCIKRMFMYFKSSGIIFLI